VAGFLASAAGSGGVAMRNARTRAVVSPSFLFDEGRYGGYVEMCALRVWCGWCGMVWWCVCVWPSVCSRVSVIPFRGREYGWKEHRHWDWGDWDFFSVDAGWAIGDRMSVDRGRASAGRQKWSAKNDQRGQKKISHEVRD
jgi:hypothetical protein